MTSRRWPAFRASTRRASFARCVLALLLLAGLAPLAFARAALADPISCRSVRLADVGWSDVTATTALLGQVLGDLGYAAHTTLLSVPVTFAAMKAGDIDVFLGNWMPAQTSGRQPYLDDRSIEIVRTNLVGAKYTLAVPKYVYDAGLRDFADIQRFAPGLDHRIYGIEAGNDGNRHILSMIQRGEFGLGDFHVVESSEQGMLAEVARAYSAREPIVFLAWDPHPMNMRFELRYLTGGDAQFGPNFGGATVHTLARAGYLERCPNLSRVLHNLEFTPRGESEVMSLIQEGHLTPEAAARQWLDRHPAVQRAWLEGVATASGKPVSRATGARPSLAAASQAEHWLTAHKLPVGDSIATGIDWIKRHGSFVFTAISWVVTATVGLLTSLLRGLPSPLLILAAAVLAWLLQRSAALAAFVAAGLLFIMNQGYWQQTLETLSLVLVSAALATVVGVPLGIVTAHRPRLHAAFRPALDLMQTLPTFVYLIPTLVLFGLGVVPAVISTVIFALPAPIRLTHLGITGVPRPLLEAGEAFGATRWQLLYKVELPAAARLIFAGITQCIMLSLSMVVIAALVGAGGLGVPVVRALNTVQVGTGFEAGLAIVLLAVMLDRIARIRGKTLS
jgi:glycine betaine/proline transport system substrate-binding protein